MQIHVLQKLNRFYFLTKIIKIINDFFKLQLMNSYPVFPMSSSFDRVLNPNPPTTICGWRPSDLERWARYQWSNFRVNQKQSRYFRKRLIRRWYYGWFCVFQDFVSGIFLHIPFLLLDYSDQYFGAYNWGSHASEGWVSKLSNGVFKIFR